VTAAFRPARTAQAASGAQWRGAGVGAGREPTAGARRRRLHPTCVAAARGHCGGMGGSPDRDLALVDARRRLMEPRHGCRRRRGGGGRQRGIAGSHRRSAPAPAPCCASARPRDARRRRRLLRGRAPGRESILPPVSSGRLKFLKGRDASACKGARACATPPPPHVPPPVSALPPGVVKAGGPMPPAGAAPCTLAPGLRSCSFFRMKRRWPKLAIPSLCATGQSP
jgi:hypothetical protein